MKTAGQFWPGMWLPWQRWLALIPLSVVLVLAFEAIQLPAALMLGPMAAGIIMASSGGVVRVWSPAFVAGQGVIGFMIASTLPVTVVQDVGSEWPVFLGGSAFTIVASSALGWLLSRARILPGTTAIWGSSPGAATTITLMSQDFGADMRLVAFMQYLRVVCCALSATLVARLMGVEGGGAAQAQDWLAPVAWQPLFVTIALALGSAWFGWRFRIPGGTLLLPIFVGLALKMTGLAPIVLPPSLLAVSYAVLGWTIGIRFTPEVVAHAWRVFPRVLASILLLVTVCGLFAVALSYLHGVDLLTAFLATSPGGADSVAILAASTNVNVQFVMAMQLTRFFMVLMISPALAKFVARNMPAAED